MTKEKKQYIPSPEPKVEDLVSHFEKAVEAKEPLELAVSDVGLLRDCLRVAGVNLEVGTEEKRRLLGKKEKEGEPEPKVTQFRARVSLGKGGEVDGVEIYDRTRTQGERWIKIEEVDTSKLLEKTDRLAGVFAVLGEERFKALVSWCYKKTKTTSFDDRIKDKNTGLPQEKTRGRGLLQTAADILALAVLDQESGSFDEDLKTILSRINQRLWKGLDKKYPDEKSAIDERFLAKGYNKPKSTTSSFDPELLPELIYFLTGKQQKEVVERKPL